MVKKIASLILPLVSIALLLWIEQGQNATYIVKSLSKVALFLLIPLFLFRQTGFPFMIVRQTARKSMKIAIGSGFAVMTVIIIAFIIFLPFIDIDALLIDLGEAGVTSTVFPFVAIYILFGNSLLEEFFFRGLLPNFFEQSQLRILVPSFFFAIYHVAIFLPWFNLPILLIAVIGLWIGGIIFQLANERSRTILPSWTIHMFADVGVLLVGVYIFYFY